MTRLANRIITLSATTFKIWFMEENLHTTRVLFLPSHPSYKGINSLQFRYIPEDTKCPKRGVNAMESDTFLGTYLTQKLGQKIFRYLDKETLKTETHPRIILLRSSEV